ncbi:MAG: hypothetical protein KDC26_12290 [Armatimonadetes bacterium]|nr:hypothetical protein [Armatimonadota bacterium]
MASILLLAIVGAVLYPVFAQKTYSGPGKYADQSNPLMSFGLTLSSYEEDTNAEALIDIYELPHGQEFVDNYGKKIGELYKTRQIHQNEAIIGLKRTTPFDLNNTPRFWIEFSEPGKYVVSYLGPRVRIVDAEKLDQQVADSRRLYASNGD